MASGFWTGKNLEADRQFALAPHVARGTEGDEVLQPIGGPVVLSEQTSRLDVMHMESRPTPRQSAVLARVPVSLARERTLNTPVRPVWMPRPAAPMGMFVGVRADVLVPAASATEARILEPLLTVAHHELALALLAGSCHLRLAPARNWHPALGGRQLRAVLRCLRLPPRRRSSRRLVTRSRAEASLQAWRAVERRSARFTGASLPLPPSERWILLTGGMSAVIGVLACAVTEEPNGAADLMRRSFKWGLTVRTLNRDSASSRHVAIIPHSKKARAV